VVLFPRRLRHDRTLGDALTNPAEAVDRPDEHFPQPDGRPSSPVAVDLVRLARPRQWIKNVLVFVARQPPAWSSIGLSLWRGAVVFAIFCVAASGTYFLNDAIDAAADRATRPMLPSGGLQAGCPPPWPWPSVWRWLPPLSDSGPSGRLAPRPGYGRLCRPSTWPTPWVLKNEPILDLAAVSAGFVLRAIAGG